MNKLELKVLCNSLVAYNYILRSLWLGCEVPSAFQKLKELTPEEIEAQQYTAKTLFDEFSAELDNLS